MQLKEEDSAFNYVGYRTRSKIAPSYINSILRLLRSHCDFMVTAPLYVSSHVHETSSFSTYFQLFLFLCNSHFDRRCWHHTIVSFISFMFIGNLSSLGKCLSSFANFSQVICFYLFLVLNCLYIFWVLAPRWKMVFTSFCVCVLWPWTCSIQFHFSIFHFCFLYINVRFCKIQCHEDFWHSFVQEFCNFSPWWGL